MPNTFVENKDRWLQIAYGDFDYSILFIKCFLPFNAWYCNNFPQHNNVDSKIIHSLKTEENIFKTRIISLLEGNDSESLNFRKNIENLHALLESNRVPSNQKRISFQDINFRENPKKNITKNFNRNTYKVEILIPTQPHNYRIKISIVKNVGMAIIFNYSHTKYDKDHLENDSDFQNLTSKMQEIVLQIFNEVNPKKKESLLTIKKKSFPNFESIYFVNDSDLLAQAIIEIIYKLRCILFHGEIIPTQDNLKIYESSYYILKSIIKTLR